MGDVALVRSIGIIHVDSCGRIVSYTGAGVPFVVGRPFSRHLGGTDLAAAEELVDSGRGGNVTLSELEAEGQLRNVQNTTVGYLHTQVGGS